MCRISSFEKQAFSIEKRNFMPSQSVLSKVNADNTFAPYYGDTVVFDLSQEYKIKIFRYINELYYHSPECFSQKLDFFTLHMTLHDLSNSAKQSEISEKMEQNMIQLSKALEKKHQLYQMIRMRTNFIINMVNTSVVLALYPVDEIEYNKLMYWYEAIDEVWKLPYPFTPHITLAYYNRYGFGEDSAIRLTEKINELNKSFFEMMIDTKNLVYQRFESMNSYETILRLLT